MFTQMESSGDDLEVKFKFINLDIELAHRAFRNDSISLEEFKEFARGIGLSEVFILIYMSYRELLTQDPSTRYALTLLARAEAGRSVRSKTGSRWLPYEFQCLFIPSRKMNRRRCLRSPIRHKRYDQCFQLNTDPYSKKELLLSKSVALTRSYNCDASVKQTIYDKSHNKNIQLSDIIADNGKYFPLNDPLDKLGPVELLSKTEKQRTYVSSAGQLERSTVNYNLENVPCNMQSYDSSMSQVSSEYSDDKMLSADESRSTTDFTVTSSPDVIGKPQRSENMNAINFELADRLPVCRRENFSSYTEIECPTRLVLAGKPDTNDQTFCIAAQPSYVDDTSTEKHSLCRIDDQELSKELICVNQDNPYWEPLQESTQKSSKQNNTEMNMEEILKNHSQNICGENSAYDDTRGSNSCQTSPEIDNRQILPIQEEDNIKNICNTDESLGNVSNGNIVNLEPIAPSIVAEKSSTDAIQSQVERMWVELKFIIKRLLIIYNQTSSIDKIEGKQFSEGLQSLLDDNSLVKEGESKSTMYTHKIKRAKHFLNAIRRYQMYNKNEIRSTLNLRKLDKEKAEIAAAIERSACAINKLLQQPSDGDNSKTKSRSGIENEIKEKQIILESNIVQSSYGEEVQKETKGTEGIKMELIPQNLAETLLPKQASEDGESTFGMHEAMTESSTENSTEQMSMVEEFCSTDIEETDKSTVINCDLLKATIEDRCGNINKSQYKLLNCNDTANLIAKLDSTYTLNDESVLLNAIERLSNLCEDAKCAPPSSYKKMLNISKVETMPS